MTKTAFIKKKTLPTNREDLNFGKKLENRCIWRLELYGAETLTPESRSEIYWKFGNVVLEKDEDHLDQSCQKRSSIV